MVNEVLPLQAMKWKAEAMEWKAEAMEWKAEVMELGFRVKAEALALREENQVWSLRPL